VFFTYNISEIHHPKLIKESPDIRCWSCAYTLGAGYWFYVTCESIYNDDDFKSASKNFFVSMTSDVLELKANPAVNFSEVYLVSPAHMNGAKNWCMHLLSEIKMGVVDIKDHSQNAFIYITTSGEKFLDSSLCNETELRNIETILTLENKNHTL